MFSFRKQSRCRLRTRRGMCVAYSGYPRANETVLTGGHSFTPKFSPQTRHGVSGTLFRKKFKLSSVVIRVFCEPKWTLKGMLFRALTDFWAVLRALRVASRALITRWTEVGASSTSSFVSSSSSFSSSPSSSSSFPSSSSPSSFSPFLFFSLSLGSVSAAAASSLAFFPEEFHHPQIVPYSLSTHETKYRRRRDSSLHRVLFVSMPFLDVSRTKPNQRWRVWQ